MEAGIEVATRGGGCLVYRVDGWVVKKKPPLSLSLSCWMCVAVPVKRLTTDRNSLSDKRPALIELAAIAR
jgi:hypothetical protein